MQKNIVITGCSSGIGLVAACYFQSRGYRIFATCRNPDDVSRMNELGFIGIEMDLNDSESVAKAASQIIEQSHNLIYALFNNAGYGVYGNLCTLTREQLEQQFATNLFGTHQFTMLLLPALKNSPSGRIINVSSILGVVSMPGRGAYSASKHALEAWSDALRMELHKSNISVCIIQPGPVNSHFSKNVHQTRQDQPVNNPAIASRFTLPPEAILPKLLHALESNSPRLRYPVTLIAHGLCWLNRLLSGRMMSRLLRGRGN